MKTRTIVIGVVAACAVLALTAFASCAGLLYFSFRNMDASVSPVIDELFAAMEGDSFGSTYGKLMSEEYRQATTLEQHEAIGRTIHVRLGRLKSKSIRQFQIRGTPSGTYATVAYAATFEKGSCTISAQLKKVGEKWQIVGINANSSELQKGMVAALCRHCGEPHTADAKFCPKCGKLLAKEKEDTKDDAEEVTAPE